MLRIDMVLSNAECAALDVEVTDLEATLINKMAGHLPDPLDTATPAYAVLDRLLTLTRAHLIRVGELEQDALVQRRIKKEGDR